MLRLVLSVVLLAVVTALPLRAEPAAASAPTSAEAPSDSTRAAMQKVIAWLAVNFELPPTDDLPRIARVSQARMNALRYRGLVPPAAAEGQRTVAIYDDATRTIYLPEGWSGNTPAEQSVLVHEMVHHLQNVGRLKHDCPQAREKLAYAAQDRWLAQFGRNLQDELEVDPFAILVRSTCAY